MVLACVFVCAYVFVCELSEMKTSLNTHIHVTIGIITENWMYRDLRQQQQQ